MSTTFSIEEVISTGLALAKRHFKLLFVAGLGIGAVSAAFQILLMVLGYDNQVTPPMDPASLMAIGIGAFIYIAAAIVLSTGLLKIILQLSAGMTTTLTTLYTPGARSVWRYFWTSLVNGVAVLGAGIISAIPFAILYGISAAVGGGLAVNIVLGFIAICVVLGVFVWLGVRLLLSNWIAVDKQLGAISAIKHSFQITQGNFWRILALLIIVGLVSMVIGGVIGGISGALSITGTTGGSIGIILNTLVWAVISPALMMITAVLYHRLDGKPAAASKA